MRKKALEGMEWKDDALKIAVYPPGCGPDSVFDYGAVNPNGASAIRKNSLRYAVIDGGRGIAIDLDFDYDDNNGTRRCKKKTVEWHNATFAIFKDWGSCGQWKDD